MLSLGVFAPLIAAAFAAAFYRVLTVNSVKFIALSSSAISAFSALAAWTGFSRVSTQIMGFAYKTDGMLFGFKIPIFALNGISVPLYALAGIVGFAATLWAVRRNFENIKLYLLLMLVMIGGLMGTFASTSILWMYIFHEFALIPTFIATIIWGGAGRKFAAMQMAVYLTLGALVSLAGIAMIFISCNTFEIVELRAFVSVYPISIAKQIPIFALMLFGLGTLVSLFPFHSWAPRAYAAAPTSFAMMHAGVLKKFGLYVLIQVAIPILPYGADDWVFALAVLALFNVIYIGFVTMAQRDLKMMVSYSSVSHMGLCFLGIASLSVLGAGSCVILMFGHGLSVALLFMLSNAIVNRTGKWDMGEMGGLYKKTPVLAAFFLAGIFASIGLPGFANFWGELGVFVSLWDLSPTVCALSVLSIVISAIYGLRAFAKIFMGESHSEIVELEKKEGAMSDLSFSEKLPAIILLAALIFVGVCPSAVSENLDSCLNAMPHYVQAD